jgi:hypothetical protein
MVEFHSSSTHPITITLALATHLALKHMRQPVNKPLLSLEGCGLKFKRHNSPQKRGQPAPAPPLSKEMWGGFLDARWRNRGVINMRGNPGSGRPG